jgi:hypothetical protein
MYPIKIEIRLEPIYHQDPPECKITVGDQAQQGFLTKPTSFFFTISATNESEINIELLNKTDKDTVPELGLDKALKIQNIGFFGISDPRFVWLGEYRPVYPEPWHSQQITKPPKILRNVDYIGWPGVWTLKFNVPVFTWIHQVQGHGWLYT